MQKGLIYGNTVKCPMVDSELIVDTCDRKRSNIKNLGAQMKYWYSENFLNTRVSLKNMIASSKMNFVFLMNVNSHSC